MGVLCLLNSTNEKPIGLSPFQNELLEMKKKSHGGFQPATKTP